MTRFDPGPKLASIRSKVLFVLSRTDEHFPPSITPGVMASLEAAGVDARYFEIDSEHGHLASGLVADKWGPIQGASCLNCRREHDRRNHDATSGFRPRGRH
jgi:homoserine O-acetyltransferase